MEFFLMVFLVIVVNVLPKILPLVIPVGLLVFGCIKHKRIVVIVGIVLTVIILVLEITFFMLFPTRFPYCDSWIMGKTKDDIIAKYGEPDYNSYRIGYNVGYGTIGFDVYHNSDYYYYIEFDDNGFANDIYIAVQPGG